MSRRGLFEAIKSIENEQPLNKKFLQDIMKAIENKSKDGGYKPSKWYKPSGLNCIRAMWFTRLEYPQDERPVEYNLIGMADTGTRRHEAIQEVLLWNNDNNTEWRYVDVEQYIQNQQKLGKCKNVKVMGKKGAETRLFDSNLLTSFMCDGIILHIPTNQYYLFEFKNQISFKYNNKKEVDKEHYNQVICYCTSLELEKAFVMYENRDCLNLEVPEIFEVTNEMKSNLVGLLEECENYVKNIECPPKPLNVKCNFCSYRTECRKKGQ